MTALHPLSWKDLIVILRAAPTGRDTGRGPFHAFNCRSQTVSLFALGVFTNSKLVLANAISFSLQMAVVYIPGVSDIFKTEPLSPIDWVMVVVISSLPLWAMEIYKRIARVDPVVASHHD